MSRTYRTTGPNRLGHNLTVTLTEATLAALRDAAAAAGIAMTELVREWIKANLEQREQK